MNKKTYFLIIAIVGLISAGGYFFYNQGENYVFSSEQQACLESGGEVKEVSCCVSVGNFPNQCQIGACGCAPENSHQVKVCDCGPDRCFDGEQCVERSEAGNFIEEGYLIKYGEKGNWGLNYEEPGKPALVVTFEFNEDSVCDLAEGKKPCSEYEQYGEVGDRIKVVGNKKEKVVEVHELIYVE